jgi:hypothetical protein
MQVGPDDNGIALIGVIIALAFLMALAATMAVSVNIDTQLRGAFLQSMSGFYAAEAGLNKGMAEFKNKFLDYQVPTGSDFSARSVAVGQRTVDYQLTEKPGNPKSVTIPAGQLFAGLNSQQYTYTVNSQSSNVNLDTEATVGAEFLVGNVPLFQFVAFYDSDLEILPGQNMTLRGRVHTNGNLYLNAENTRTLSIEDAYSSGITSVQVSAKGDIYRGRKNNSDCRGTVSIDKLEDVVAPSPNDLDPKTLGCGSGGSAKVPLSTLAQWKGSIVSQIQSISVPKPDIINRPPGATGVFWQKADLRIALVLNKPGNLPAGPTLPHSIEAQDASGNVDPVKTGLLHLFIADTPAVNPNTSYTNGAPRSVFGTRPVFYSDVPVGVGNCTCTDANATNCPNDRGDCYPNTAVAGNPPLGGSAGSNNRVYMTSNTTMMGDSEYRRGGFYNYRERKWIYLLNINLGDLLEWNRHQVAGSRLVEPSDNTDGGIVIHLSVVGPYSGGVNNYGVRIFGSANLYFPTAPGAGIDPTGVTVVTDQAMYIQGNFNQGNQPPPNPPGAPAPPAGNLAKQPVAVLADSINVLSSRYFRTDGTGNDRQSNKALNVSDRDAASTTINAAFLAGVDTTEANDYNGGLENYPRFHEDWGGGNTLYYLGSFVSLGEPIHVAGRWCGTGDTCNIYNPPARQYDYEPMFNSVANLPPLTPRFVYVQQVLFTEDFK